MGWKGLLPYGARDREVKDDTQAVRRPVRDVGFGS
jgi:hypothetical protein